MHEFDKFVYSMFAKYMKINANENRTMKPVLTKTARRVKSRVEKAKNRIAKQRLVFGPLTKEQLEKIRIDADIMRKNKSTLLHVRSNRDKKRCIRFSYVRYADDWIILTNAKKDIIIEMKEKCSKWLLEELKFTLDESKTNVINLDKTKAKFLGFTIFRMKKRIIKKANKSGKVFRQRSTVELTIGIDHERVRNRLIAGKILDEKLKPRSNTIYRMLKPVYIVQKYRQRLEGLINYYYRMITFPNELSLYYYAYKFFCLKTLARRMDKSIKQVTFKYGEELNLEMEVNEVTLKGTVKRKEKASFPTY